MTNHHTNCKSMNGPRYNQWWLYVIDLHNHHAIGDVRHAVNPTVPFRMKMIVERLHAATKKNGHGKDNLTASKKSDHPQDAEL